MKKKKKKKFFLIILFLIGILLGTKLFHEKSEVLNNKEIVDIIIKSTMKEETLIPRIITKNKLFESPIRLLKEDYQEVIKEEIKVTSPKIYIYNSHPTEEYQKNTLGEYILNPTVRINNYILEDIFNKKGYQTLVEEESVKDILERNNWNYSYSYKASRLLMENAIKTYPSLEYFIDVHRDSLEKEKTYIKIEDRDYAKVLFIVGLENPNYEENLEFTERINQKIEENYPGLSKGIYKKEGPGVNGVYNQDFSNRTILIEIGGYENTTTEVLNTSIAFSKCFLEVIYEENN